MLDDPVCSEDLFPTLLGLAGLRPHNNLPGTDPTPLIHGQVEQLDRPGVLLEFVAELRSRMVFHNETWRSFRSHSYKYVVKGNNPGAKTWLMFDLNDDPGEQNNLLEDPEFRDEIACHQQMLCDQIRESEDRFVVLPTFGRAGVNT